MIRKATFCDNLRLVELAREFYTLAKQEIPFDEPSVLTFLDQIREMDNAAVFVIERGGEVVGGAGVLVVPCMWNFNVKTASEMFWFVSETARGTIESLRLFYTLEKWAKSRGAITMTMTALAANPRVGAIYELAGYTKQEIDYVRTL